ncbi:MAG: DUF1697 domain-containing protein [Marmoricola sp.]
MPTWIAFLRAVNVGGRPFPMAELRDLLTEEGYDDVRTHIQTGNVRLDSPIRSPRKLATALESVLVANRGFDVPTVVFSPHELRRVADDADEIAEEHPPGFGHYVELLREAPGVEGARVIEGRDLPGQRAVVRGRAVHLLFDIPYHKAKGPDAAVKRAMGVSTNRNAKVVRALAERWGEDE